jgi:hypothetical protein
VNSHKSAQWRAELGDLTFYGTMKVGVRGRDLPLPFLERNYIKCPEENIRTSPGSEPHREHAHAS